MPVISALRRLSVPKLAIVMTVHSVLKTPMDLGMEFNC